LETRVSELELAVSKIPDPLIIYYRKPGDADYSKLNEVLDDLYAKINSVVDAKE
jgi:hypothetical protein